MIKSTEEKTVSFFKTIEAGDIAIFNPFDEAVAVFGYTKAGKTCSCHILCNSIVRAEDKDGELMYVPVNQKYSSAIVGVGNDSQTEIPNIFQTQVKGKNKAAVKVCVLDQPGYGDSYGFHRIFSNGYFHYRTFSKTPKLKFILAFKKSDLEGTALYFKRTILNFISMFITYNKIKPNILAATAFLVTKANPRSNIQDITAVIKNLKNIVNDLIEPKRSYYQQLIQHMIDKAKIFVIERPDKIGDQTRDNNMLQQIYDKTEFWVRPYSSNSKNVVNMDDVNFSVANEILRQLGEHQDNNQLFKEQYAHFMNHVRQRTDQILVEHPYSLKNVIKILKEDALGPVEQHSFLTAMESFIDCYYDFDPRFQQQRTYLQANLFKSSEAQKLPSGAKKANEKEQQKQKEQNKQMRMVYFLKKFNVLEYIEKQTDYILSRQDDETVRSIEELEGMSTFFIEMFKKMDLLRLQHTDSPKIIYKYSYVIQRLIEQAKIITLILFNKNETRVSFEKYNNNQKILFADIFRLLKDKVFTQISNKYNDHKTIGEIKAVFCKQVDIGQFELVNEQILTFFEQVENTDQSLTKQVIVLLIRYADIVNTNKTASPQEKKFLALKLLNYRQKCYKYFKQLNSNKNALKKEKQETIEQVFLLSNLLASLLMDLKINKQARAVYKSIANVQMVFKLFDLDLQSQKNNAAKYRQTLMNYGHYAATVHRRELAIKCYQEAYSRSSLFKEIREAGRAIADLQKKAEPTEAEDAYLRNFYNENFCSEIDDPTVKEITDLIKK